VKLYYAPTLNARKACAVARHLQIGIDYELVDLSRGEQHCEAFARLNPNRKVPLLVEGRRSLWEANAIMCRLSQIAGAPLWPGPEQQAEVLRWLSWDAAHFTRFGGELYFQRLIRPHIQTGPVDAAAVREAEAGFRASAAILDDALEGRAWAIGSDLSIADFALASALPYAEPAGIPFGDFPRIRRWYEALNELEGWRRPFPDSP